MSSLLAAATLRGSGLLDALSSRSGPSLRATVNSRGTTPALWSLCIYLFLASQSAHVSTCAGGRPRRGGGGGAADPPPSSEGGAGSSDASKSGSSSKASKDKADGGADGGAGAGGGNGDGDGGGGGGGRGGGGGGGGGGGTPSLPDDADEYEEDDGDDDDDDWVASPARPAYRSPFEPSSVSQIRYNPIVIRGHYLPPEGSARLSHPSPFTVVGDTRYERTRNKVSGKAAHELEFVYNVCAWVQHLHNRHLTRELDRSDQGRPVSVFDRESRVALHQLFVLTSARYKVLDLATHDGAASETLRALVFDNADDGAYCPAFDFLRAAQDEQIVKISARRHGERYASGIRGDPTAKGPKPGKGGRPKGGA